MLQHEELSQKDECIDSRELSLRKLVAFTISVEEVLPGLFRGPQELLRPAEHGKVVRQDTRTATLEVKQGNLAVGLPHGVREVQVPVAEPFTKRAQAQLSSTCPDASPKTVEVLTVLVLFTELWKYRVEGLLREVTERQRASSLHEHAVRELAMHLPNEFSKPACVAARKEGLALQVFVHEELALTFWRLNRGQPMTVHSLNRSGYSDAARLEMT